VAWPTSNFPTSLDVITDKTASVDKTVADMTGVEHLNTDKELLQKNYEWEEGPFGFGGRWVLKLDHDNDPNVIIEDIKELLYKLQNAIGGWK